MYRLWVSFPTWHIFHSVARLIRVFGSFISTRAFYFIMWIHHNLFVTSSIVLVRTVFRIYVYIYLGAESQGCRVGTHSAWLWNCCPQCPNGFMFSLRAFVQDVCLATFLPTSALVRLYFCQSDGREVVSHLHLYVLSMRSGILSCSWAIWVSSGQIAYVPYPRIPIAAFATRKPN